MREAVGRLLALHCHWQCLLACQQCFHACMTIGAQDGYILWILACLRVQICFGWIQYSIECGVQCRIQDLWMGIWTFKVSG